MVINMNINETIAKDLFKNIDAYWEVIPKIKDYFLSLEENIDTSHYTEIKDNIWIGENVSIDDTSIIKGPCIIDDNTTIGPYAYLRENTIIGKNCHIGHAVEIKNSIIFNNCQISHFNYAGDSIIGNNSHLAAGVIISNLKNDGSNIKINNIEVPLRKLGAIIHDNVEVGCNSVIYPGTIIYSNVSIYPLTKVRGVIEENTIMKDECTKITKNKTKD